MKNNKGRHSLLPCEGWEPGVANRIFERGRELNTLIKIAIEASRDLRTWLHAPGATASRDELGQLVALVDSLLTPAPVGAAFAITPWNEWVSEFDGWIALVAERADLRSKLTGYDESKLLALDLTTLNQKWVSAQSSWFLLKWLRIGGVRRQLRTARPDQKRPEVSTLKEVLVAALRLQDINKTLSLASEKAEGHLGLAWAYGEPQSDMLIYVRSWGATLHDRIVACAADGTEWQTQLRELIAGLFKDGPASYAVGTTIGNRLVR